MARPAPFPLVDWSFSSSGITPSLAHDREQISLHMKGNDFGLLDTTVGDVIMDCGASDEAFGRSNCSFPDTMELLESLSLERKLCRMFRSLRLETWSWVRTVYHK
ncbi:hypothetical protein V6N12_062509 [Hibiscus sabdariffa]|uniref:Uncharacterized protein n=1 Tax=Hibiscus sabdariffa TaxID=183260 RepID=A0ABR2F919_9ROSI